MTEREREILALLREDPMIMQKDLANRLGIERSSVAVHIANLMKKGFIQGKGYIITDSDQIVVIGGANVDISGRSFALKCSDSAEGQIHLSAGGVARNIAEACGRLGAQVKLLSAVGSDPYGDLILKSTREAGVDVSKVHIDHQMPTSAYLAVLDATGDMVYGINDMKAIQCVSPNYIKAHYAAIRHANVVIVDANLTKQSLEAVSAIGHNKVIADTVSTVKAQKLRKILKGLYGIKPNRHEAQIMSGVEITDVNSAIKAVDWFHQEGVQHVVISLGSDGLVASDGKEIYHLALAKVEMVNATGAGDAFIGAWAVYCTHNLPFMECIRRASLAARINVTTESTIHEGLSLEQIERELEEVILNETVLRHSS